MRLYLIRHTSVCVPPGFCYGRWEAQLSPGFDTEARRLVERFGGSRYLVYTSPAGRCRRLAERLSAEPHVDKRLCELDFGLWEGRLWDELPGESVRRWCDDFVKCRVPGGESFEDLAARAKSFASEVFSAAGDQVAVAVTHAGVIRALIADARRLPLSAAFSIPVSFGEIFEVRADRPRTSGSEDHNAGSAKTNTAPA